MSDRTHEVEFTDESLQQLVDSEHGLVSARVFADQDIYRLEAEQLFLRSWLYLAHESQLRDHGDFFATYMGEDPILVVRQRNGSIKAMVNACRHRGMSVCRADSGNAKAFTCPYHGWSYDGGGRLVNVPNLSDGYNDELDTSEWGLLSVPRIESYKGLVFGTFEADAPPLLDHLGDMTWYLDCLLDRRDGGTEVIGGVHKIRLHGNWKLAAEQFVGDNYHAGLTHASATRSWLPPDAGRGMSFAGAFGSPGRQFASPLGHGTAGFFLSERAMTAMLRNMGQDQEIVANYYDATMSEVAGRLGKERAAGPSSTAATVFPNFSYLAAVFGSSTIGVWHPKGTDRFESWRFGIVDTAAPPEVKAAMTRNMHVWPFALADSDDGENWSGIAHSLAGPMARRLMFNYQMGMGHEGPDDIYPGPINAKPIGEGPQRSFYRRWLEFLTSDTTWPDPGIAAGTR